jgi:hypothetical protein
MSSSQRPTGRRPAASKIAQGAHSTWGSRPRGTCLPGLEVGSQQPVGGQAPLPPGGCPQGGCTSSAPSQGGGCSLPYGRTHCSCTTDGGSLHHLPVASPPPPTRPARPPDFMATATQGRSCTFAIQAGLSLVRGACKGAASTVSCSVSEGFGRGG